MGSLRKSIAISTKRRLRLKSDESDNDRDNNSDDNKDHTNRTERMHSSWDSSKQAMHNSKDDSTDPMLLSPNNSSHKTRRKVTHVNSESGNIAVDSQLKQKSRDVTKKKKKTRPSETNERESTKKKQSSSSKNPSSMRAVNNPSMVNQEEEGERMVKREIMVIRGWVRVPMKAREVESMVSEITDDPFFRTGTCTDSRKSNGKKKRNKSARRSSSSSRRKARKCDTITSPEKDDLKSPSRPKSPSKKKKKMKPLSSYKRSLGLLKNTAEKDVELDRQEAANAELLSPLTAGLQGHLNVNDDEGKDGRKAQDDNKGSSRHQRSIDCMVSLIEKLQSKKPKHLNTEELELCKQLLLKGKIRIVEEPAVDSPSSSPPDCFSGHVQSVNDGLSTLIEVDEESCSVQPTKDQTPPSPRRRPKRAPSCKPPRLSAKRPPKGIRKQDEGQPSQIVESGSYRRESSESHRRKLRPWSFIKGTFPGLFPSVRRTKLPTTKRNDDAKCDHAAPKGRRPKLARKE